jgi:hypothetical protein
METIDREKLKAEIDQLDSAYLDLAYRIIRQFPHRAPAGQRPPQTANEKTFSQRWRGRFPRTNFSNEELESDPKLAYLARRYGL